MKVYAFPIEGKLESSHAAFESKLRATHKKIIIALTYFFWMIFLLGLSLLIMQSPKKCFGYRENGHMNLLSLTLASPGAPTPKRRFFLNPRRCKGKARLLCRILLRVCFFSSPPPPLTPPPFKTSRMINPKKIKGRRRRETDRSQTHSGIT